jgi:hypothetical protein
LELVFKPPSDFLLEAKEHLAEIGLEHALPELQLSGGLLHKAVAVAGAVELERVDEKAIACADQEVDAERVIGGVLLEAPHAPLPVTEAKTQLSELRRRRLEWSN